MGMIYTDCNKCREGKHEQCGEMTMDRIDVICTCEVCN